MSIRTVVDRAARWQLGQSGVPRLTTGKIFYVDSGSGSDSGAGSDPGAPFATLDYAVGRTTANSGDVIYLMPGHSETITATNTLTLDVAGITVIGLGYGNDRPTFLIDGGTTAQVAVSAADVRVENCIWSAGHADIVRCFNVTAAGFTLVGNEFKDNTTNENFVDFVDCSSTTNNNADRLTIIDNVFISNDANAAGVVEVNADLNRLRLENNRIVLGNTDEAVIGVATGKDLTNLLAIGNYIDRRSMTQGNLLADPDTTDKNTGLVAFNVAGHSDTATEVWAPVTCEFRYIENYATAVVDASGYILPAVDS